MKIGVVGAGYWGRFLVRTFCHILGDENVVVCDINKKILRERKKQHPGIETTADFKSLLTRSDIAAINISTPVTTHFTLARQALLAKKHTLVEKPLTTKAVDAQKLVNIAKKNNLTLMVDHLLLYHPAIENIKRRIEKQELGKIYYLYSQRLNLGIVRREENVLLSLGPHDISVFLYLLNKKPEYASANGRVFLQKDKSIEDIVFLNLGFKNNIHTHAHLSWLDPNKIRRLTVVGSKKMVIFDDMEARNKVQIFDKSAEENVENQTFNVRYGDVLLPDIQPEQPLARMCQYFIASIREKKQPRSDGVIGVKVVQILEAAQKSLKNNGKPIKLNL